MSTKSDLRRVDPEFAEIIDQMADEYAELHKLPRKYVGFRMMTKKLAEKLRYQKSKKTVWEL